MRKFLATAVVLIGTCGAALALPASPTSTPAQHNSASTLLQDVQWSDRHHRDRRDVRPRHRDWRGSNAWDHPRYRGWHRYHARPYDWRARRCVAVGPMWLCP